MAQSLRVTLVTFTFSTVGLQQSVASLALFVTWVTINLRDLDAPILSTASKNTLIRKTWQSVHFICADWLDILNDHLLSRSPNSYRSTSPPMYPPAVLHHWHALIDWNSRVHPTLPDGVSLTFHAAVKATGCLMFLPVIHLLKTEFSGLVLFIVVFFLLPTQPVCTLHVKLITNYFVIVVDPREKLMMTSFYSFTPATHLTRRARRSLPNQSKWRSLCALLHGALFFMKMCRIDLHHNVPYVCYYGTRTCRGIQWHQSNVSSAGG